MLLQAGKNEWSDGSPVNFHMFDTQRLGSISIYQDILKYFWFTQMYGKDDGCRFDSWNESICLSKHDKIEFCGFSDWNAKFCFDSYSITMRKLSFIEKLLNQPYVGKEGKQCTLMVVLLPRVRDIMWISIPCEEKLLDNATLYCSNKDPGYYSSFNKATESLPILHKFDEIIMYQCEDSSLISKYFLFDGKDDCFQNENETELFFKSLTV